jgi:heme/copper-type cytochrome/quinol oxidase subunit 3
MLLNSLIFLLLSNSITSRRDKSILYSRITITILLISAFIAYDNLSFLFLAKGIGIFGGLFHTTATTNTFHVFIFLITSVTLLTKKDLRLLSCGFHVTSSVGGVLLEFKTLFIFIPEELLSLANILALLIFNL